MGILSCLYPCGYINLAIPLWVNHPSIPLWVYKAAYTVMGTSPYLYPYEYITVPIPSWVY